MANTQNETITVTNNGQAVSIELDTTLDFLDPTGANTKTFGYIETFESGGTVYTVSVAGTYIKTVSGSGESAYVSAYTVSGTVSVTDGADFTNSKPFSLTGAGTPPITPPPPPGDPPATPANFTATASTTLAAIDLSWTNAGGYTSQTLQRSTNSNFTSPVNLTIAATAAGYSNTALFVSTTYYYRLSATNASGTSGWATANATTMNDTSPET